MALSRSARMLALLLVLVAILSVLALTYTGGHHGIVVIDDMDLSDSLLGAMVAVPIVMLVFFILIVVFAGVGVVLAGALAVALFAVAFALLMVFLPVALFFAIPLLAIYGLIRLLSPSKAAPTQSPT